jgi:hypothetical protein
VVWSVIEVHSLIIELRLMSWKRKKVNWSGAGEDGGDDKVVFIEWHSPVLDLPALHNGQWQLSLSALIKEERVLVDGTLVASAVALPRALADERGHTT